MCFSTREINAFTILFMWVQGIREMSSKRSVVFVNVHDQLEPVANLCNRSFLTVWIPIKMTGFHRPNVTAPL